MNNNDINVSKNLKKLSEISEWFDSQETVDVEEGLVKVREAATLIKESKARLKEIENEFHEIKKDMDGESLQIISRTEILTESLDE